MAIDIDTATRMTIIKDEAKAEDVLFMFMFMFMFMFILNGRSCSHSRCLACNLDRFPNKFNGNLYPSCWRPRLLQKGSQAGVFVSVSVGADDGADDGVGDGTASVSASVSVSV